MKKLAVVTTHPIQYNAPWFKLLADRKKLQIKVFYTWGETVLANKYDPDFRRNIEWDIPLLDGYSYEFATNVAKDPGSHHFQGIVNPGLIKAIENWSADFVLVIGWSYKSHLACLRHFKGRKPVLFRGDSNLLDEKNGLKTIVRRIFLKWVYRHIDRALYVGTNSKAYFKIHGVKEGQLIPALHAIDNERFAFCENIDSLRNEYRAKLGIRDTDFVLLFAGKLEEKKNPFFLLELAKRIQDSDVTFLLVGNGHLEQPLRDAAKDDPRIKFLEFQNQSLMPAVYALGSIFVLPSNGPGETWGLAVNEAMAAGLPVLVSSKAGGSIDLIHENGMVFHPQEVKKVCSFLQNLRRSPGQLASMKEASLEHIKKFNFVQIAEAVEKACLE